MRTVNLFAAVICFLEAGARLQNNSTGLFLLCLALGALNLSFAVGGTEVAK